MSVLPYIADHPAYLGELSRVTRRGGLVLVSLYQRRSLFVAAELAKRPRWGAARHLVRTGVWTGGFIDRAAATQAHSARRLDRMAEAAGLEPVTWFAQHARAPRFDRRPLERGRLGCFIARHFAWEYFGLYRRQQHDRDEL